MTAVYASASASNVTTRSTSVNAPPRRRRADIQGLRAVAVLLVIGNHAGVPGFGGGFVGVDVFFVISGYVITGLLLGDVHHRARRALPDFYCRRIRRIVPAATATLVCTLVAAHVELGTRASPSLPGDVRWASLFAANARLMSTGSNYFVPGVQPSLVTHFWSLAVEEQFYLAWPLVVFTIVGVVAPSHRRRALAVTLTVGVALSAWWSVHLTGMNPVAAYYSPLTRGWELGLGCLLAVATQARPTRSARARRVAAATATALLAAALCTVGPSSAYPGWRAWLPCAAATLCIWAGSEDGGEPAYRLRAIRPLTTRGLSVRPLAYVGDLSFSLYLVHYPLIALTRQGPWTWAHGWDGRLLSLGATAVCAVGSFHLLENPVRRCAVLAADRLAVFFVLAVCVSASWAAATVLAP